MSRTLSAEVDTALQAPHVPMLILVELTFDAAPLRFCNASYDFEYGGFIYYAGGRLMNIKNIQEGVDQQMYGIEMSISGIDPAIVNIALNIAYQQRPITIRFAPLTSTYQIIATPPVVWKGRMDRMDIELGETAAITLTAESRMTDWNKASIRRFNDEDQKAEFPTDKGFEYVAQMVNKVIDWGVLDPAAIRKARVISSLTYPYANQMR